MCTICLSRFLAAFLAAGSLMFHVFPATAYAADETAAREIVVTQDLTLDKDATLGVRLVIRASGITIDGNGATLVGPGAAGKLESFQGNGVAAEGCRNVTIRNLKVKGFAAGLVVVDGEAWRVENCDFSDNYHDPEHGWGDGPRQGGILLTRVGNSVLRGNHANRVWNGLDLNNSHKNLIVGNDFSHCSNVCLKLMTSCDNRVLENDLSYGLRISPGEVHARDSTCVLIESGSDDNYFYRNDITHGGDGLFIRVLNSWVSRGNVFVENDCSYANNNCVEAWSPGNTYIRNTANHGSYGFWLGGSDQTVLIGNEAAYNGMPDGFHNAPEGGFSHGGIVIVGGPSSHSKLLDNYCHHNNGGGIVFRGDVGSQGKRWRTHHWIVQNNRLENNRWPIWGLLGDWIHIAGNRCVGNENDDSLEDVANLARPEEIQPEPQPEVTAAPVAAFDGPSVAIAGRGVVFDASASSDPQGRPLTFRFDLGDSVHTQPRVEHVFSRPGFYRVGMTVSNGLLADLAFRDLIVVEDVQEEIGTEGDAARWGFEIEGDPTGAARVVFDDDSDGIAGRFCLRFRPAPYPGMDVVARYPAARDARWDLSGRKNLVFWIKFQNPNIQGFQDAGPVIYLDGPKGRITLAPAEGRNYLPDGGESESRWLWKRLVVPLAGGDGWTRQDSGQIDLGRIDAVGMSFDSWAGEPFTIWLDGLRFE